MLGVTGATVQFSGVDVIDGTPVIDLKPYVTAFAQWLRQRERLGGVSQDLGDLLLFELQVGGQLGDRRPAAQLSFEPAPRLGHAGQQIAGVHLFIVTLPVGQKLEVVRSRSY